MSNQWVFNKVYVSDHIYNYELYFINFKQIKFSPNEDIYPLMNYSFVGSIKIASQNILNVMKLQELKKKTFYKTTSNYSDISLNIVG